MAFLQVPVMHSTDFTTPCLELVWNQEFGNLCLIFLVEGHGLDMECLILRTSLTYSMEDFREMPWSVTLISQSRYAECLKPAWSSRDRTVPLSGRRQLLPGSLPHSSGFNGGRPGTVIGNACPDLTSHMAQPQAGGRSCFVPTQDHKVSPALLGCKVSHPSSAAEWLLSPLSVGAFTGWDPGLMGLAVILQHFLRLFQTSTRLSGERSRLASCDNCHIRMTLLMASKCPTNVFSIFNQGLIFMLDPQSACAHCYLLALHLFFHLKNTCSVSIRGFYEALGT